MGRSVKQLVMTEVSPSLGRWSRSQHVLLAKVVHRDLERKYPDTHFGWLYVLRIVKAALGT